MATIFVTMMKISMVMASTMPSIVPALKAWKAPRVRLGHRVRLVPKDSSALSVKLDHRARREPLVHAA